LVVGLGFVLVLVKVVGVDGGYSVALAARLINVCYKHVQGENGTYVAASITACSFHCLEWYACEFEGYGA